MIIIKKVLTFLIWFVIAALWNVKARHDQIKLVKYLEEEKKWSSKKIGKIHLLTSLFRFTVTYLIIGMSFMSVEMINVWFD